MKNVVNPVRVTRQSRCIFGVAICSALLNAVGVAEPQYIRNLSENGFLASPVVAVPVVTLTAGDRFMSLVPESQLELCEIAREYYASAVENVTTVRIVSEAGQVLLTCGS